MLVETVKDNQFRWLVDYIYLRRVLKFSSSGLISLFKNPEMKIEYFKNLNKERVEQFLYKGKRQKKLTSDPKFERLFSSAYIDENYIEIEKMVKYCIKNHITIFTPNSREVPILFRDFSDSYRDLIFIKGQILESDLKSYSICGTRNPTLSILGQMTSRFLNMT